MSSFIKQLTIFISPLLVLLLTMELILRNIPNDYTYKNFYLKKNSKSIEVLILGSSHAYFDINPELITLKSFNASHISQSIDYDYKILLKYANQLTSLKYIILPISYFSLFTKLEDGIEAWRVKNYSIYYNISLSFSLYNFFELSHGMFIDNIKRGLDYIIYRKNDITCTKYGFGKGFSPEIKNDLQSTGIEAARRHSCSAKNSYHEIMLTLNKIIEYAKEHKIQIILFTPPAYIDYIKHLDQDQLNITIRQCELLSNMYCNVEYKNYLHDKSFIEKDFFDADHLNINGARKLSIKLNNVISKIHNKSPKESKIHNKI